MDVGQRHTDIHSAQQSDTHSLEIIATLSGPDADPCWSLDGSGLLRYDGRIWVPDVNDLHLRILLNNHDGSLRSKQDFGTSQERIYLARR